MKRSIYILSGPAGVGKSTTSKELVQSLERSAYISGDDISHLPVKGRGKPWICEDTLKLTWKNILSLTKNLIEFDYDVVIDYVTFPKEVDWVFYQLKDYDIRIVYVVFMVNLETLLYRDKLRPKEVQMGERSAILLKEFEEALINQKHVIETDSYTTDQIEEIINTIKNDERFLVS
jgi:predicted kinase